MPLTLSFDNMRCSLALKWTLRLAELDYVIKDEAIFVSTPERLAGEPRRFLLPVTQQPKDETWEKELHQLFQKKVSFQLVDKPLVEAIHLQQDFSEFSFIFHPEITYLAYRPVTLDVTDIPFGEALQRILAPLGLDYTLEDEAVFISRARR